MDLKAVICKSKLELPTDDNIIQVVFNNIFTKVLVVQNEHNSYCFVKVVFNVNYTNTFVINPL